MADNAPTPEETAAAEAETAAAAAAAAAAEAATDKTFTQADIDRIVQERVARVKATPPADYEDLKAKAAQLDELEAANKTELEKAQERAAKLEQDAAEASERAQRILTDSAIIAEAAKRGVDTDIARAMIDRAALEFDSDGNPSNVAAAMDALLEAKPQLAGGGNSTNGTRQTAADQGARGTNGNQLSSIDGMTPNEIAAAVADGSLNEYLTSPTR